MLNKNDITNNDMFSKLQGNILKGHGRNFTTNIFIRFDKNRDKSAKKWIAEFSESKLTSCKKQLKENELFKRNKISGGVFYGILLTAPGYQYLGKDISKFEKTFQNGMKKADLQDPDTKKWEEGFRKEIHAMILIGDDNQEKLGIASDEIIAALNKFSSIVTIEYGNAIRNANGDGIEHFGYVDGISQPLFFDDELKEYEQQNAGKEIFNPSAEKELVLVKDPFADSDNTYGSYFVFRKLEQNVQKFKKNEEELAKKLNLKEEDEERAGASIVGRYEDGTPVEMSKDDGIIGSGAYNNFDYKIASNSRCPYHAHIRKTNPRTEAHKEHIMARRGIPYGYRNVPASIEQDFLQMPESGVGLLFMSFQASIKNQFEHIQGLANQVNPANDKVNNLDPVIGQDGLQNKSTGDFPVTYNNAGSVQFGAFESAVTLKGGEYFFAPSIPFLKNI
ncbi:Dyp-type peroxidase domain-containing protein [Flavobacterium sp.]|uniref:Dyp-type peroxidase n=1 Tax=Flavobacterium sp. TaxID=239 RepID=UPI00286A8C00|nr:Dyp-type peroxidase domain-containing protein [Flavobacterium sp.]